MLDLVEGLELTENARHVLMSCVARRAVRAQEAIVTRVGDRTMI